MYTEGWAIDSYGLRAAHEGSVLDQLHDTDRLHVSPMTWHPGGPSNVLAPKLGRGSTHAPVQLALVDGAASHGPDVAATLDATLMQLHGRGVVLIASDHECDPQHVADVEASWKHAGLVWRPTDETLAAVMTAERLGVNLVTEDSDVRKLAEHWQVYPMTVREFALSLAA